MPNVQGDAATRLEFRQLATRKVAEAKSLLEAGQWAGAYDACGYAVECGLKACICARRMKGGQFPDKQFAQSVYTHDLEELVKLANLSTERQSWTNAHTPFGHRWSIVAKWNQHARYLMSVTETDASDGKCVDGQKIGSADVAEEILVRTPLLESMINGGAKIVEKLTVDRLPSSAAFWMEDETILGWKLVLAFSGVAAGNPIHFHKRVLDRAPSTPGLYWPSLVRIEDERHPLISTVRFAVIAEYSKAHAGFASINLHSTQFAPVTLYIYKV